MSQYTSQAAVAPKMTKKERRMAKEIKGYQEYSGNFFPDATFRRLVTSVTEECLPGGQRYRFNAKSMKALQIACEEEITSVFAGSNILAHQAGRDTVTPLDIQTFQVIRKM